MNAKPLQIKVLGGWTVTYGGKPLGGGSHLKIVLHALVMGHAKGVYREDLARLLADQNRSGKEQTQAVRNVLSKLRGLSLDIPPGENPVFMSASQPHAAIDLWEFFGHVRCERYQQAYELIRDGQEPHLFRGADDPNDEIWQTTLEEFRDAHATTIAAIEAPSGRQRSIATMRERLLARSLVPGVGRPLPIRAAREKLEPLPVPWVSEGEPAGETHLPAHLATLLTQDRPIPNQAIVVGGSGAGKTLAAISTFLRLTDPGERAQGDGEPRPVLYVDPETEGSQSGFGSDAWLEERLREVGAEGDCRPIVIVPHGDTFLAARQHELGATLDSRLFRDHDLLLCCGTQFYTRRLCYEAFGNHVIHLKPWSVSLQRSFATAIAGEQTRVRFDLWVQGDPTRRQLCSVPLHLVHVLSLLGEDSEALAEISTPSQLLEGVARMRLRVGRCPLEEDEVMNDLAALAHRFYVDATPSDRPIRFTVEEMKLYLRTQGRKGLKRRTAAMVNETFLTFSSPGRDTLRFEDPSWGWFFVARHMVNTALHDPGETLKVFSKLLSAGMAELCEEMLTEKLAHSREQIYSALDRALRDSDTGLERGRLAIAREQVGYLLGALGDRTVRRELAPLVESRPSQREADHLVRRGLSLGLADGGATEFADLYVEMLERERGRGGPTPQRDANIGFLLSSRGDQAFDPERPGKIVEGADPIRTVGDLVRELDDPRHAGSWRIKLFTLLDLSRHPAIAPERFAAALEPHRERIGQILDRLEDGGHGWPEPQALRERLDTADPGLLRAAR